MSGIISAIRGGLGSNPIIEKDIELAKENGEIIHFLYVIKLEFLVIYKQIKTNSLYKGMDRSSVPQQI